MKGYREQGGDYIEVQDGTRVADTSVQVAIRPSKHHVFADNWNTAPMDAAVCWRLRTQAELDDEIGGRFDNMDKTEKAILLVVRSYCNALQSNTYTPRTVAQLRADFVAAFKLVP